MNRYVHILIPCEYCSKSALECSCLDNILSILCLVFVTSCFNTLFQASPPATWPSSALVTHLQWWRAAYITLDPYIHSCFILFSIHSSTSLPFHANLSTLLHHYCSNTSILFLSSFIIVHVHISCSRFWKTKVFTSLTILLLLAAPT